MFETSTILLRVSVLLSVLSLLVLAAPPDVRAQTQVSPGASVGVLVCVPDATGTLSASEAPCPASPVASLQVQDGVIVTPDQYKNLLLYDGPIDQTEGQNLALTTAGTVIALYLLSHGIGMVLRMIRRA